jgi:hypothetical protein
VYRSYKFLLCDYDIFRKITENVSILKEIFAKILLVYSS